MVLSQLTPRERFQQHQPWKLQHQELVVSDAFRAAAEAALVEQVLKMPMTYDPDQAAAAYNRLMGARDFLHHLLTLAENPAQLPDRPPTNLDHSIR